MIVKYNNKYIILIKKKTIFTLNKKKFKNLNINVIFRKTHNE